VVKRLTHFLEMLGGARPLPERVEGSRLVAVAFGCYWALCIVLTLAFAGRGAKFIYIDF
jgi:hypothetical protein